MTYLCDFPIEVVRSQRKKSASINVKNNHVIISVPKNLSDFRIQEIINKKSLWIKTRLKEQKETSTPILKEFVSGESFPYLGKNFRLKIEVGDEPLVKLKNGYIVVQVPKEQNSKDRIKYYLEEWYKIHAINKLKEKTIRFSKSVGVTPKTISIKNYKARWGSCSANGDITYNWKIILAPHRVVDYVVIHELCHLLEHNHSPRYWKLVARHMQDWKTRRDWLKTNDFTF